MQVIDDYILELEKNLVKLPDKERHDISEFYREFLLDGSFSSRATIEAKLGSPKQLAHKILADFVPFVPIESDEPRLNLKIIRYILLGMFTAPLGIPLVLAIAVFIFIPLAVAFAFFMAFMAIIFALLVVGGISFIKSIALLFTSNWAVGGFHLGMILVGVGIILLLLPLVIKLINLIIAGFANFMRYLGKKIFKQNYYQTDSARYKEK